MADVGLLDAFGSATLVVEVRTEIVEVGVGSDSRCQMMTRIERPTATIAFFLPRRWAMRRYRSPRNVSVRRTPTAASPSARARYRLPLPVPLLPFFRPADSAIPGANRAHDARCAGVGNRVMSRPIVRHEVAHLE